jgi:hypothetical protein
LLEISEVCPVGEYLWCLPALLLLAFYAIPLLLKMSENDPACEKTNGHLYKSMGALDLVHSNCLTHKKTPACKQARVL